MGFISEWNYRKKISYFGTFFEISLWEFTISDFDCLKAEATAEMLSDGIISPLKAGTASQY